MLWQTHDQININVKSKWLEIQTTMALWTNSHLRWISFIFILFFTFMYFTLISYQTVKEEYFLNYSNHSFFD